MITDSQREPAQRPCSRTLLLGAQTPRQPLSVLLVECQNVAPPHAARRNHMLERKPADPRGGPVAPSLSARRDSKASSAPATCTSAGCRTLHSGAQGQEGGPRANRSSGTARVAPSTQARRSCKLAARLGLGGGLGRRTLHSGAQGLQGQRGKA